MFRSTISIKMVFSSIGLLGISLCLAPSNLWSQESSAGQDSSRTRPFAGFDDSLTAAADDYLGSADLSVPPATGKDTIVRPSPGDEKEGQLRTRGGQSGAALRLNTLRPIVEPILRAYGVPNDLSAVILVESGGQPAALSPKGARGLWQLMPDTARRYGLRVDDMQDDRVDPLKATDAAARYLHDLFARFGDWKLALAAYNTGEANVGNAISRAHTQDFDQLVRMGKLPLETTNYVPLVLAAIQSSGRLPLPVESHGTSITVFASSNR